LAARPSTGSWLARNTTEGGNRVHAPAWFTGGRRISCLHPLQSLSGGLSGAGHANHRGEAQPPDIGWPALAADHTLCPELLSVWGVRAGLPGGAAPRLDDDVAQDALAARRVRAWYGG